MRLLFVTYWRYPDEGGLSSSIQNLRMGLAGAGVETAVLAAGNPDMENLPLPDKPRRRLPRMAKLAGFLSELEKTGHFDAVCFQDVYSFNSGLHLALPKLLTIHGFASEELVVARRVTDKSSSIYRFVRFLEKRAYRRAPFVIAVSSALASHIQRMGGQAVIVPNGIDTGFFQPLPSAADREAMRNHLGLAPGQKVIAFTGRLARIKGMEVLMEALRLLPPDYLLFVAGTGEHGAFLHSLALSLGIDDRVRWLGSVGGEEVRTILQVASVACLPSVPMEGMVENSSMALLEAMSCGTPVVASSIGGLQEAVQDGLTGRLVPPGDAAALAQAIAEVADTPAGQEAGRQARQWVEQERSLKVWAERYLGLVEKAMSAYNNPRLDVPTINGLPGRRTGTARGMGFIVFGTGRSGTSAVAGCMHLMGITMGFNLLGPSWVNEKGFFEDADFVAVNKSLIERAGGSWYHPPSIERLKALRVDLGDLLEKRSGLVWGFKDPRTVFTYFVIREMIEQNNDPVYVFVNRSREAVIKSLMRTGLSADQAEHLHNAKSDLLCYWQDNLPKNRQLHIEYESLMIDPRPVVASFSTWLGFNAEEENRALTSVKRFLDPQLQHF